MSTVSVLEATNKYQEAWGVTVETLSSGSIFQSHVMFYLLLIYFIILPPNVSSIPESSNLTHFKKTNSMIANLSGKQYSKSIISLPLLESAMLKEQNSIVQLNNLAKQSFFFFRIFLLFTVHPKGQMGTFVVNYIPMVLVWQIISYIQCKIQVIFFFYKDKFWWLVCFVCIYFQLKPFVCLVIFKWPGLSYKFWTKWSVQKYNWLYLLLCNIMSNMIEIFGA